jgi:hypothetical protein
LIDLDSKKLLGSGGEANVFKHNNLAFKIYHDPTITRARKLKDFINLKSIFSKNIVSPIDVIMDTQGRIIGFTMNVIENCKDIRNLLKTDFRNKQQIGLNDVIKCFVSSKTTLDEINKQQIIVGDLNDLNQMYDSNFESFYIDVDSFQFGSHPCIVGTEDYIDPNLYGVDLTTSPKFTQQTDWYSFAVLLFKALLFVHPYAGVHKNFKSLFTRAQNKIWVFDSNVIKPKIAINPEILSNELLDKFNAIFCKGDRIDISLQLLQSLQGTFIKCTKCNASFSNTRQKCPVCQKVIPQQVSDISTIITNKKIGSEECVCSDIFGIEGTIIFCKVVNDKIFVVYFNGKETRCRYIFDEFMNSFTIDISLWNGIERRAVFDFFEPFCLVIHYLNNLIVFDISENKLKPITKTMTVKYQEDPVFCCSKDSLYRLTSNAVLKGQISNGHFIEQEIVPAIENQTWIQVGQNDLGLGFYRIFNKYQFFVFSRKGRFEIEVNDLKGQIIDFDVKLSMNTLLLLRKNLENGRTYSHLHLIDDHGKINETRSEESLGSDLLKNIYGKAFAGSVIIHPTDAGIVIEKHGDISLKVSTENFVSSSSQLFLYKQGILVLNDNKVSYLILKS